MQVCTVKWGNIVMSVTVGHEGGIIFLDLAMLFCVTELTVQKITRTLRKLPDGSKLLFLLTYNYHYSVLKDLIGQNIFYIVLSTEFWVLPV